MDEQLFDRKPAPSAASAVITTVLIIIVVASAIALTRGAPADVSSIAFTEVASPSIVIAASIFGSALVIAAAMVFCCCRRCGQPNLAELLRILLAPFYAALRVMAASIAAIAATITALAETLSGIVATLAEIAEAVRRLNVAAQPPDTPDGQSVPGSGEVANWIDTTAANLKNGADTLAASGQQLGTAAQELVNAAPSPAPPLRRPI